MADLLNRTVNLSTSSIFKFNEFEIHIIILELTDLDFRIGNKYLDTEGRTQGTPIDQSFQTPPGCIENFKVPQSQTEIKTDLFNSLFVRVQEIIEFIRKFTSVVIMMFRNPIQNSN